MGASDVLDLDPVEVQSVAAPAPKPAGAPLSPEAIIAGALKIDEPLARDIAGRVLLALSDAGWLLTHPSEPGKSTRYRVKRDVVAGEA